ncbi:adenylosuccinate lyase [Acidianus sulfidivorans JP7]|uniref:Adenylosuccinate lyase n=1 Tax=Acidianus sulfidivorans JP7 TaxID=619593 RepID=A0A2U9IMH2_9CREN|nr:adenylosuccinate lyase [Acidianus sulfidivorans]AWR97213.1 adenylosuccinate lyase [Acidianus sulfidivorans JP7]
MSICPLDWRYGSNEMRNIFSRDSIIRYRIKVELALLNALKKYNYVTEDDIKKVEEASKNIDIQQIDNLENKVGHDVMAMVIWLAEKSGDSGRYIHYGATSYDIVDTAYALMFRDALKIIKNKLVNILDKLTDLAIKYENTIMIGRTHGQHALPITFGFKVANYIYEISRSLERIIDTEKRLLKIKFSGAVGTMAAWGEKGLEIEKSVSEYLGLPAHEISTQIAPRDGFAEIISDISILGSQLDRFALEVRELMRPEIRELSEGVGNRVGSSTMPHKENPVTAEKISGLAKVLRGLCITELENIPLWHERDLTNSSSERIVLSHAFLIIDEMLDSFIDLLDNLIIYPNNMKKNLEITNGLIMAESLMINLTLKGLARHKAHELSMRLSREAEKEGKSLLDVALSDTEVTKYLSKDELSSILNPENYLGELKNLIARSLNYYQTLKGTYLLKAQNQ